MTTHFRGAALLCAALALLATACGDASNGASATTTPTTEDPAACVHGSGPFDASYDITFDAFPDGTAIVPDTAATSVADGGQAEVRTVAGDEFTEWGLCLGSLATANCLAIYPELYAVTANLLSVTGGSRCGVINAGQIEVSFARPVTDVTVVYHGATANYILEAFADDGLASSLGASIEATDFSSLNGPDPQPVEIGWQADGAPASRIVFSGPRGATNNPIVVMRGLRYTFAQE